MNTVNRQYIARCLPDVPGVNRLNGDFRVGGWPEDDSETHPAAVLVPIVDRADGMTVLLTQRTDHLHHHPGQVSFPGGRMEAGDEHPIATAMRETEEEIGLRRQFLEVAGYLDLYKTVTGFLVTPVVAFVATGFELSLDTFEVANAFEVPLSLVMDPDNYLLESRVLRGMTRRYYVIPYEDYRIWGATAAMLVDLGQKLAGGEEACLVDQSGGRLEKKKRGVPLGHPNEG